MSHQHKDNSLKVKLLSGKLLAKNSFLTIGSIVIPLLIGVVTLPIIIDRLGEELFGLLIIIWSIIGYSALLDLGLGKALIKYIAECIGKDDTHSIRNYFWTAFLLSFTIGTLLGTLLYLTADLLVNYAFNLDESIVQETKISILYVAFIVPFIFTNTIFNSFFKAYQKFALVSVIQITNSSLNYILPVIVYVRFNSFNIVVLSLLVLKVFIWIIYLVFTITENRHLFNFKGIDIKVSLKKLLGFGLWISLSNFISPLINYIDRFLIASIITLSAVAIYSTPLEIILKISMIASGISAVFYSAISNSVTHNKAKTEQIINTGLKFVLFLIFPVLILIIAYAYEGIELWIGQSFAIEGAKVTQIVGIGVLFQSMAFIPISYLQSIGKPSIIAKIHLTEIFIYSLILYLLVIQYGVIGAAIAHALRLIGDYSIISFFAIKSSKEYNFDFSRYILYLSLIGLALIPFPFLESFVHRLILWSVLMLGYLAMSIYELRSGSLGRGVRSIFN